MALFIQYMFAFVLTAAAHKSTNSNSNILDYTF